MCISFTFFSIFNFKLTQILSTSVTVTYLRYLVNIFLAKIKQPLKYYNSNARGKT